MDFAKHYLRVLAIVLGLLVAVALLLVTFDWGVTHNAGLTYSVIGGVVAILFIGFIAWMTYERPLDRDR